MATSLGNLLLSDRHLDSLPVVKDVLGVIFPSDSELRRVLGSPDLWLLWQRRRLIVHRRGLIDASYLAKTSDAGTIGSRLSVAPLYVEASFSLVGKTATAFVRALGGAGYSAR